MLLCPLHLINNYGYRKIASKLCQLLDISNLSQKAFSDNFHAREHTFLAFLVHQMHTLRPKSHGCNAMPSLELVRFFRDCVKTYEHSFPENGALIWERVIQENLVMETMQDTLQCCLTSQNNSHESFNVINQCEALLYVSCRIATHAPYTNDLTKCRTNVDSSQVRKLLKDLQSLILNGLVSGNTIGHGHHEDNRMKLLSILAYIFRQRHMSPEDLPQQLYAPREEDQSVIKSLLKALRLSILNGNEGTIASAVEILNVVTMLGPISNLVCSLDIIECIFDFLDVESNLKAIDQNSLKSVFVLVRYVSYPPLLVRFRKQL